MIDLGRHMWDHCLACSFIFNFFYYIYEIMIVYEWQEDFEVRLSQVRSDATSSVDESQITPLDPAKEQWFRTRSWVVVARLKHKGHLYGTGDLAMIKARVAKVSMSTMMHKNCN